MNAKKLAAIATVLVAIVATVFVEVAGPQLMPHLTQSSINLFAFSMTMNVMYIGCGILFLLGLKSFTAKLKVAYGIMASGIMLFALSELQVPVSTVLSLQDSFWMVNGLLLLPITLSIAAMYIGVKRFAKLYDIHSIWGKGWFVAPLAIGSGVVGFFFPLGPEITTVEEARGNIAFVVVCLVIFAASSVLTYKIQHQATETYRKAMRWFFAANLQFGVATLVTLFVLAVLGNAHWMLNDGYTILIQSICALVLLKAAYEFNAIGAVSEESKLMASNVSVLDIIFATAQKASNINAIDPLLEDVRLVTSHMREPNRELKPEDEAVLVKSYQDIERYLVETEPVRRYTKQELRQVLHKELRISGEAFFDRLP